MLSVHRATASFTHVDPFEDTERGIGVSSADARISFTHVDPFEDTERGGCTRVSGRVKGVSPTSIRSRILKGQSAHQHRLPVVDVSPTSIRSRILKVLTAHARQLGIVYVSPTSIRSRILKVAT